MCVCVFKGTVFGDKMSDLHKQMQSILLDGRIKRNAVNQDYESMNRVLGSGVNGKVILLRHKTTGKQVAMTRFIPLTIFYR